MRAVATIGCTMVLAGCAACPTPYETALQHPDHPTQEEVAWFRCRPAAQSRLVDAVSAGDVSDDAAPRVLAWSLLRERALSDAEVGRVLDQAFHLIVVHPGKGRPWWVFDRRTAPEFVYIRPQIWVYLRDGNVVSAEPGDSPGNGVEVHTQSSGAGPFAGMLPVRKDGSFAADEFRIYYKVTGVSEPLSWLKGFEGYLGLVLSQETAYPPTPVPTSGTLPE